MTEDSPRSKIVRHARKLMAATAAIGVASVTTHGSADTNAVAAPAEPADASAAADGAVSTQQGYMVVDPIPPPARGCGCGPTPGSS